MCDYGPFKFQKCINEHIVREQNQTRSKDITQLFFSGRSPSHWPVLVPRYPSISVSPLLLVVSGLYQSTHTLSVRTKRY